VVGLKEDPANPLAQLRKEADIDKDFFTKFWMLINLSDSAHAQKEYDLYMKYTNILVNNPTLYFEPQNLELSREEARLLAFKQFKHYFSESSKIQPMSEVLTSNLKIGNFFCPMAFISMDVAVKMAVSL